MLVKLLENPAAGGVTKKQIKAMVDHYRNFHLFLPKLKYAHFNVYEVLELFIANKVFSPDLAKAIKDEKKNITDHGVKIYIGRHCELSTCPPEGMENREAYMNKATTILCNTDLKKKSPTIGRGFPDVLKDEDYLLFSTPVEGGDGLDQAEIAPPFHADEDEIFDIGTP